MFSELCKKVANLYSKIFWKSEKKHLKKCGCRSYIEYPFIMRGGKYIQLGENVRIHKYLQLDAIDNHNGVRFTPRIIIGNNVSINYNVHIGACNEIIIEDGVLIASKVFITDHYHGMTDYGTLKIPPSERVLYSKGRVVIEREAWIGEGVAIMPGVRIGRNAVIGANSVVTHDIPAYSIAVGVPAKVISDNRSSLDEDEKK